MSPYATRTTYLVTLSVPRHGDRPRWQCLTIDARDEAHAAHKALCKYPAATVMSVVLRMEQPVGVAA